MTMTDRRCCSAGTLAGTEDPHKVVHLGIRWLVGRLGLEPRTHGLKVGCPAAPGVLPAQMLHVGARKAHNAQGRGQGSSHESFHDRQAEGCPIVTESRQRPISIPAGSSRTDVPLAGSVIAVRGTAGAAGSISGPSPRGASRVAMPYSGHRQPVPGCR
jgi:hypothetical protein